MKKVIKLTYSSVINGLCSVNSSFDSAVLRIAYHGENPNRSAISKEVFERCLPTMFGCPIVCHYDRDSDTLGGHDVEIVRDEDGSIRLINLTTPVGFVPQGAKTWWEMVEESDGTEREYLCCEVLLWKRQEAYRKIKKDGIAAQSMEITVKDGAMIEDVFHIYDFEFTAFALIGVAPCFESAAISTLQESDACFQAMPVYAAREFMQELEAMMLDVKQSFHLIASSDEDNDILHNENDTEGGERVLQEKTELAAKYGIQIETLDFSVDDYSIEELTEKFEAMCRTENAAEPDGAETQTGTFALTGSILEELCRSLEAVTVTREWGECSRYWYVDCDFEACEVYCWDSTDWLLYGFTYSMNGDNAVIDFESKKRKKYVIEDFDEGEQSSPVAAVFQSMERRAADAAEWERKYNEAAGKLETMEAELTELRTFRKNTEAEAERQARDEVLGRFADLTGIDEFEALHETGTEMSPEELAERCYAIRGRHIGTKFALDEKAPKLIVAKTNKTSEPYGGLFAEYGIVDAD